MRGQAAEGELAAHACPRRLARGGRADGVGLGAERQRSGGALGRQGGVAALRRLRALAGAGRAAVGEPRLGERLSSRSRNAHLLNGEAEEALERAQESQDLAERQKQVGAQARWMGINGQLAGYGAADASGSQSGAEGLRSECELCG